MKTVRAKINLDTMSKINKLVAICTGLDCKVDLIDGEGYRVSAKSLMGVIATIDWTHVYVECEQDIYSHIKDFLTE
jgi:phosphotransferase system HPr-like phosphotransfer protein